MTLRRTSMTWSLLAAKPTERETKYWTKCWTDSNAWYYYDPVNDLFYRVILKPREFWYRSKEGLGR